MHLPGHGVADELHRRPLRVARAVATKLSVRGTYATVRDCGTEACAPSALQTPRLLLEIAARSVLQSVTDG